MDRNLLSFAQGNVALFLQRLEELLVAGKRIIIAIDGNSAAGKTTFARQLAGIYEANVFHMDDFFLPPELRTAERLREPGGNVDYVRFRDQILAGLERGGVFQYQAYDCKTDSLQSPVIVEPRLLNIVEGVYSLHPMLEKSYDLSVFLGVEPAEQLQRIFDRNGPGLYGRFVEEWIPLENHYFDELKIREKCDFIYYNLELLE